MAENYDGFRKPREVHVVYFYPPREHYRYITMFAWTCIIGLLIALLSLFLWLLITTIDERKQLKGQNDSGAKITPPPSPHSGSPRL